MPRPAGHSAFAVVPVETLDRLMEKIETLESLLRTGAPAPGGGQPEKVWYTRDDLCERWGVSKDMLREKEQLGELPPYHFSAQNIRYFWSYVYVVEGRLTRKEADALYFESHDAKIKRIREVRHAL